MLGAFSFLVTAGAIMSFWICCRFFSWEDQRLRGREENNCSIGLGLNRAMSGQLTCSNDGGSFEVEQGPDAAEVA